MTDKIIYILAKAVVYILWHAKFESASSRLKYSDRQYLHEYLALNKERFEQ